MKKLSSTEIRARLAEIENLQAQHQARDFDGELKDAMLKGANIDDLENKQLEDERIARRLRVEQQALKEALPDVVRSEVRIAVERLAESGKADQAALNKHIGELIALDQERLKIYALIDAIHDRQDIALEQARALTGAGRAGGHGESHGEEKIVSDSLAKELVGLLTKDAPDLSQIPAHTSRLLNEHLFARANERDRARQAVFMKQVAEEKAA
jgi:hypothetical protein